MAITTGNMISMYFSNNPNILFSGIWILNFFIKIPIAIAPHTNTIETMNRYILPFSEPYLYIHGICIASIIPIPNIPPMAKYSSSIISGNCLFTIDITTELIIVPKIAPIIVYIITKIYFDKTTSFLVSGNVNMYLSAFAVSS